jgi:hypothetical protein
MSPRVEITEHAQLYSGGSMLVRPNDPELDALWPIENWIEVQSRSGGWVFRRRIIVVSDWEEVSKR